MRQLRPVNRRGPAAPGNQRRSAVPFQFEYRGFAVEGFGDSLEGARYGPMPTAKL